MSKACLVALVVSAGVLCPSVLWPQTPPEPEPMRVEVRVVNVYATVKDRQGRLVDSLNQSNFAVLEDKEPRDIGYFARENELSVLLILLVDTSTSQKRVIAREQKIAAQFARQVLRAGDQVALVGFDSNAYLLLEPTPDPAQLEKAWERIVPFAPGFAPQLKPGSRVNGTRMCAALSWAAEFQADRPANRKVIVLISDGVDAELDTELRATFETLLTNDVMVYSIRAIDAGMYPWWDEPRVQAGIRAMRMLARETGGRFFPGANLKHLTAAFEEIAAEVRSQYSLAFNPKYLTYNARFHRIDVTVNQPGLSLRARRGYFSPSR